MKFPGNEECQLRLEPHNLSEGEKVFWDEGEPHENSQR
jgi:hypothetical protein